MAQWLENLKSLVHFDFGKVKEVKLKALSDIKDNKFSIVSVDNSKNLIINVDSEALKDPQTRQRLLDIVREAPLERADQPLLEVEASREANDIVAVEDGDGLLQYFTGKVPDADLPILKAAAFIKKHLQEGRPVQNYKEELRARYGKRADIITNLYSADYFETHIKPMYEELAKRPNFSRQLFVDNYNILIEGFPFAIFVHRSHTREGLREEIIGKMRSNRSYGIKMLNLHAIGQGNVNLLNEVLLSDAITCEFSDAPSTANEGNIMIARIFF